MLKLVNTNQKRKKLKQYFKLDNMILETISKNKVYYMFRCDDRRRKQLDIPTDNSFSLTEIEDLTTLLEKCNLLKLNYDLVIQRWDEVEQTIVGDEIQIVMTNYKNIN